MPDEAGLVHVRLEILKVLIPAASRHGISEPQNIVESARMLEKYVVESPEQEVVKPDASDKRTLRLPRKDKQVDAPPAFMTPPTVDKSNQTNG